MKCGDKVWSRDWSKSHPEPSPPGDVSHIQTPNLDAREDANKCFLTGACYSCLLRGSTWEWQIQRHIFAAPLWNEHRVPSGRVGERTEWAIGGCNHRKNNNINQPYPLELPGTKPPITHGVTHGSKQMCARWQPCWTSMGEKALGPLKARCPSVGEC